MTKFAIIVAFMFLQPPLYAQWTGLSEWIFEGTSPERIRRLAVNLDTNAVLRRNPTALTDFLTHLSHKAALKKDEDLLAYIQYFQKIGGTLFESDAAKRIAMHNSVYQTYLKSSEERFQAISLHNMGQENFILGNYAEAFEKTLASQRLFSQVGFENIPEIGKYLHDLALNYYYFRDYAKVKDLMLTSLKYPSYSQNVDIQRYNTLALAYGHLHKPDSAKHHFRSAIVAAEGYRDTTWIALATGNLGSVFAEQKDYARALPLMMTEYGYHRGNRHNLDMAKNSALNIAEVLLHRNVLDSAKYFLQEVHRIEVLKNTKYWFGQQQRDEEFRKYFYTISNRYYLQSGDTLTAYKFLDSLSSLTAELDGRYNSMVSRMAEGRLENQRYLSEIELEKQRAKTSSLRWLLVFSALFIIALTLGLLYYLNTLKTTRQRALAESTEHALLAKQERIESAFQHAKKDLMHQLNLLGEKNLLIEKLSAELITLRAKQEISPEVLESAISQLGNARLLTQADWATFRRSFNVVFNGALDKIKADYPDITHSEERIYALNKLEVGTKQMADMLGISPESVRKSKYRLKKRLENV